MTSPLYDLPGRSSLGFAVTWAAAPAMLERLEERISPEEAGERMRAPLMRPYALQLFILLEGYLMGREQRLLDASGDLTEDQRAADAARTEKVVSWFARASGAYRTDDALFCGPQVVTQPVLEPAEIEECAAELREWDADTVSRVQRAFGFLELYSLTLHGEQRDGIFDHGPYPHDDGILVFHEVNDLQNDYLPWSTQDVRLPVDAVGVVRAHPPVGTTFDMFGTMSYGRTAPEVCARALWRRERGRLRTIGVRELESIAERAVTATGMLYRRVAEWAPDFRIRYGAPLFANHLVPFLRLAEADDVERWLDHAVAQATEEEMPRLGDAPRSIWTHLAAAAMRGGELFHPVIR